MRGNGGPRRAEWRQTRPRPDYHSRQFLLSPIGIWGLVISAAEGGSVLTDPTTFVAHRSQHPSGVAVDTCADVYVTDEVNKEVLKQPPR